LIGYHKPLLFVTAAVSIFGAEKIEIIRDSYGVPHVYARTAQGVAYGSGYAQAADRGHQLLDNLQHAGKADPSTLSPTVRGIVESYCAGVNAYFGSPKVDPSMVVAFSRIAFGQIRSSNDIFIAPSRSSEGGAIAVISPSAEWSSASLLYAIDLETSDRFAFAGLLLPGLPFPWLGHSNDIAISAHGDGQTGPGTLDEAWALVTSKTLAEAKGALAGGQLAGQKFFIATASGEIYDSRNGETDPPDGILTTGGGPAQAVAMLRELLLKANTFSVETAAALAYATDIYKAEAWLSRMAKSAPDSAFVRMLSGWNRKADWNSRPALGFYLFKMALDSDAGALEPPMNFTEQRLHAALRRAQDRLETEFAVDAGYGAVFRIMREGARRSWPVGGGTNVEAGMATPREIAFEHRGAVMVGHGGQAGLIAVALAKPVRSVLALPFGESESLDSTHFEDQARDLFSRSSTMTTWFEDRKNLERRSKDRKELTF
jgi:acyl-homoserine lactone acylase PvdQ